MTDEAAEKTSHPKIFVGRFRPYEWDRVEKGLARLLGLAGGTAEAVRGGRKASQRTGILPELAALGLSGCATIGPGLHLSDRDVAGRGTPAAPITIEETSPALLTSQAEWRAVPAAHAGPAAGPHRHPGATGEDPRAAVPRRLRAQLQGPGAGGTWGNSRAPHGNRRTHAVRRTEWPRGPTTARSARHGRTPCRYGGSRLRTHRGDRPARGRQVRTSLPGALGRTAAEGLFARRARLP